MLATTDSTAIYVALIGGLTTVMTGALALLGVWITSRNQLQVQAKDRQIAELEKRLDQIEDRAPTTEGDP